MPLFILLGDKKPRPENRDAAGSSVVNGNSAALALFAHHLHGASEDYEHRPCKPHESLRENADLPQKKQQAECDDKQRDHGVMHASAFFPLHSISFHHKNKNKSNKSDGIPRPLGFLMHAFKWAPVCFLIHELSTGHIAFGPAPVLPAKHLIPLLDGPDAAGTSGRILRHAFILLE